MNLIALDVSSKCGYAFFKNGELAHYGTLFPEKKVTDFGSYPSNFMVFAEFISINIVAEIQKFIEANPEKYEVVIEETNAGRNNYSQKMLEFIHFALIKRLNEIALRPKYIRTGVWRKICDANQSNEEKKLNAQISRIKRKTGKKVAKIDGKVVGKRTRKHSALRAFQAHFSIELARKMEDAAEAALIGLAFMRGAPICDGTVYGGTLGSTK